MLSDSKPILNGLLTGLIQVDNSLFISFAKYPKLIIPDISKV